LKPCRAICSDDDRSVLVRVRHVPSIFFEGSSLKFSSKLLAAGLVSVLSSVVLAQQTPPLPPANVVQLSASASIEVQQDLLTLNMTTSRDGPDPSAVQSQLKQALETALVEAKKVALAGQMDVRTGNFNLSPRYARDGKMTGWQGTTELVLEGRDFARIGATAGKIQTLTMGGVAFGLSREQRSRVEADAQSQAIDSFKAKAAAITKSFGFTGYTLREVSVIANDQGFVSRPRMMAMEAKASSADAPMPLEAGKSTVMVTVSGSVQLK
jgi:predicted secreted protein